MVSISCWAIVYSGFNEVSGSWKTMPICLPRMARISSSASVSMRWPCNQISPDTRRPGASSRPMMADPVSDFPAPDSPTRPRISPAARSKLTSLIAVKGPCLVGNSTTRFLTESSGLVILLSAYFNFGLSASRNQSPSRLTESANANSVAAG